jgi:hypothetical protein
MDNFAFKSDFIGHPELEIVPYGLPPAKGNTITLFSRMKIIK